MFGKATAGAFTIGHQTMRPDPISLFSDANFFLLQHGRILGYPQAAVWISGIVKRLDYPLHSTLTVGLDHRWRRLRRTVIVAINAYRCGVLKEIPIQ